MLAFQVSKTGAPPQLCRIDRPEPAAGEVRIRIIACGLNFADLLQIDGRYQERATPPFVLGMEIAGIIDAVGAGVVDPAPGCRVAVLATSGGLAEYVCAPADRCLRLPDHMGFEAAAAFQITYATSHVALHRRAALKTGETLLVTGAAGGVGLTAVELGKLAGARVIAVARGAERLAVAQKAGADHLIDSDLTRAPADLKAALKALGGVDVAYETIGGDMFTAALGAMRPEGRLLAIGFAGGTVPQIPANILLVKNIAVIGFYVGGYAGFAPGVMTGSMAALLDLYAQGRLHPHASHVLPLTRAAEALALLRTRQSTGKVVVRCDQTEPVA